MCDRENSRIQLFSQDGEYLDEWTTPSRPCEIVFDANDIGYCAALGLQVGMYFEHEIPGREKIPARVGIYSQEGELLSHWGEGSYGEAGHPYAAHTIAVDSRGDLYLGEVRPGWYGMKNDPPPVPVAPEKMPVLHKFAKRV